MMKIACPDDTGRMVWVMYRNKPTQAQVIKIAVQLQAPDGVEQVLERDQIFPTKEDLIASLDPK